MICRLRKLLRVVRARSFWSELPDHLATGARRMPALSQHTRRPWPGGFSGIALLLAGVSMCEDDKQRALPATSADEKPPVSNEHTVKCRIFTDKGFELTLEDKYEDAERYLAAALIEAIKGFGTDDLHTAAARLHLASHYKYRGKYDLALPLYNEAVASLTRTYGQHDIRTAVALQELADLHMARQDAQTAMQVMQKAVEAKRLALGPTHPDVTELVLALAAIHRESGGSSDAIELLQEELAVLTEEGKASTPGVIVLARRLAQEEKEAGQLSDAEATCRTLSNTVRDDPGRPVWDIVLCEIVLDLAGIVRAQGRLDEARQLCEQAGQHAGMRVGYWPAVKLQAEIELEIGSRDSLLRALNHLQPFCQCRQMYMDDIVAEIGLIKEVVWYKPRTWGGRLSRRGMVEDVWFHALSLTEAQQLLARVQTRLDWHRDAFTTLKQAHDVLGSPVLAESLEILGPGYRLSEEFARWKQEVQEQMSPSYEAGCNSRTAADGTRAQCARFQRELSAALAA